MLYELREYELVPGKRTALLRRFADHTLQLFREHGMAVCGFWQEPSSGNVIYLLGFEGREHLDGAWRSFRADPRWLQVKEASEANGPLVSNIASRLLETVEVDSAPLVAEPS